MALPFLPGTTFNYCLGKTEFHKSHHLDASDGNRLYVGISKPGIGGERRVGQIDPAPYSTFSNGFGQKLASWVAFDKQALCFDAYFTESVAESRLERYTVRRVKIYFYLEDDSIMVVEPRIRNSGLGQGTLVRRQRIKKPPPQDHIFYVAEDFNLRGEIDLLGRVYKVCDCDAFTRNFLTKLGVRLGNALQFAEDTYLENRKANEECTVAKKPADKSLLKASMQFYAHDRHVLRFYAYWDDRQTMFGEIRKFALHYFLSDDTVEIKENLDRNSGRDKVPYFISRCKLPKEVVPMKKPGELAKESALNVVGKEGWRTRHLLDALNLGIPKTEYYKDCDLTLGTVINVLGRHFVIYDMDNYTKEFFKIKYGINITEALPVPEEHYKPVKRMIPPYNGFGSEEDSLRYCFEIMPTPPKRDFIKLAMNDRRGFEGGILRFSARLVTDVDVDKDRQFIFSFYLTDDSVAVHESRIRNSGFNGGTFWTRNRIKKPLQERFKVELSEYYGGEDFYVGAVVDVNGFHFLLVDADQFVYNYMEKECHKFPHADVKRIMKRFSICLQNEQSLRKLETAAAEEKVMSFPKFCSWIKDLIKVMLCLSDHEIITLSRYYEQRQERPVDLQQLITKIQAHLSKFNFDNFIAIYNQCIHHDGIRCGWLEPKVIRMVIKACRVPCIIEDVEALMKIIARQDGLVNYDQLVCLIDWKTKKLPMTMDPLPCNGESIWAGTHSGVVKCVNLVDLVHDLKNQNGDG